MTKHLLRCYINNYTLLGYNTTVNSIYLPLVYAPLYNCNMRILPATKISNILIHEKADIINAAFVVLRRCYHGAANNG